MSAAPEPVTAVLARRVRDLCDECRWNARDLAKASGVAHASVYRIFNGENVSLETAAIVVRALGSSLGALLLDPEACWFCHGAPRPGYACLECGAAGPEVTGGQPGNGTGESQ